MKRTVEEQELLKLVGHALWRSEIDPKGSADDRKASWVEGRRNYMARALKLVTSLNKEGLSISKAVAE